MKRHQRIVRASLDAEISTHVIGVEILVRQRRKVGEERRPPRGQAKPGVEERGTVADGDGEARDRRTDGLAGVEWWIVQVAVIANELAPAHALGCLGPVLEQGAEIAALDAFDSRSWRRKASRSWAGVTIPA